MTQHIRSAEELDPQLGIASARRTAIPKKPTLEQPSEPQWHYPRRMIGPDLIKALRDLSLSQTGNKESFDFCVVQTNRGGMPSAEIDVKNMRLPQHKDEFTYRQLIRMAHDRSEELYERHIQRDLSMRVGLLHGYLQEAAKDGFMMWTLSTDSMRSLIFPNSYLDERCDNVFYEANPRDGACGKQIELKSLNRNHVMHFLGYAKRMAPTIDPLTITPVALEEH